jgi:nitrate reductase cytochrome c-type subunit
VDLVRRIAAPTLFLSLLAFTLAAGAEHELTNEDCLTCHSDKTLTDGENGKTVSLYVDGAKLSDSIHGSMFTCVDCHSDAQLRDSLGNGRTAQRVSTSANENTRQHP